MKFGRFVAVALMSVVMTGGIVASASAQDAIKARKDAFQDLKKAMGTVKATVDAKGPAADVVAPANVIVAHAATLPTLFPKGSDTGDTKALPAIWSDFATFEGGFKALGVAAQDLAKAGSGGDMAAVAKAFGGVGGTCSNCHDRFRAK